MAMAHHAETCPKHCICQAACFSGTQTHAHKYSSLQLSSVLIFVLVTTYFSEFWGQSFLSPLLGRPDSRLPHQQAPPPNYSPITEAGQSSLRETSQYWQRGKMHFDAPFAATPNPQSDNVLASHSSVLDPALLTQPHRAPWCCPTGSHGCRHPGISHLHKLEKVAALRDSGSF